MGFPINRSGTFQTSDKRTILPQLQKKICCESLQMEANAGKDGAAQNLPRLIQQKRQLKKKLKSNYQNRTEKKTKKEEKKFSDLFRNNKNIWKQKQMNTRTPTKKTKRTSKPESAT